MNINDKKGLLIIEWVSDADLALTGTCWHQDAESSQNQSLILASVWQHLALAGIGKQLVPFSNGIDHGIAGLRFSMAIQYHAICLALFMVFVLSRILS